MRVDDLIDYLNKYKSKHSDINIDISEIDFNGVDFILDSREGDLLDQIEDLQSRIEYLEEDCRDSNHQNSRLRAKIDSFKQKFKELYED